MTITFYRPLAEAIPPMPADRTALGSMPASALQYCEAVSSASGNGWYLFPALDADLTFDGHQTWYRLEEDEGWQPLDNLQLEKTMQEWNSICPPEMTDKAPPLLSSLHVPGFVQIWSGLMARTSAGTHCLVRPLANVITSSTISVYEGIVATDIHAPWPIFINIRMVRTNEIFQLRRHQPLFQLQLTQKHLYDKKSNASRYDISWGEKNPTGLSRDDWNDYSETMRPADITSNDSPRTGEYASNARKAKAADPNSN